MSKTKDRIFKILTVVDDSETSMKSAEYSVEEWQKEIIAIMRN